MIPPTLDYAPRPDFDVGRLVARYLQVLAWLSIASMIVSALFFDALRVDLSPFLLFWAASALKRRSRTARAWVIGLAGLSLGVVLLMLAYAVLFGTGGTEMRLGGRRIRDPALWQVAAFSLPLATLVGVPFFALRSRAARLQFAVGEFARTGREDPAGLSIESMTTPSAAEIELLRRTYAAFNARDIPAALANMTPDVAWPRAFKGGFVRGHDAVRAYWTEQWSEIDPHVEPVGFTPESDGRVLVDVLQVVRDLAGKVLADVRVGHHFTFEGGLIAKMEVGEPAITA